MTFIIIIIVLYFLLSMEMDPGECDPRSLLNASPNKIVFIQRNWEFERFGSYASFDVTSASKRSTLKWMRRVLRSPHFSVCEPSVPVFRFNNNLVFAFAPSTARLLLLIMHAFFVFVWLAWCMSFLFVPLQSFVVFWLCGAKRMVRTLTPGGSLHHII